MTEHLMVEYMVNCAWQIPLLALAAWLLVKVVQPEVVVEHWLWLAVLVMAVLLPIYGISPHSAQPHRALDGVASKDRRPVMKVMPASPVSLNHSLREAGPRANIAVLQTEFSPLATNRTLRLSASVTRSLAWIYTATILLGGLRFARAWLAAQRLVGESCEPALNADWMRTLDVYARRLRVKLPRVRESSELVGPVIIGVTDPVMLLPKRFADHGPEETGAALFHELAHVRRRDYLVNLLCQVVALPVVWHPAAFWIQTRVSRTREMVCDSIAAQEMASSAGYARCLVSLATQMVDETERCARTQAMGLFENNTMEERVMKLTEPKVRRRRRAKVVRGLCGIAAMVAVTAAVMSFHVRPTFAAVNIGMQAGAVSAPSSASAAAPAAASASAGQAKPSAQVGTFDKAPLAIARGNHAKVIAENGEYVHRWKAADGEQFVMVNRDPKEPSSEEQQLVEKGLADSQEGGDERTLWLESPKVKLDMEEVQKKLGSIDMKRQIEMANRLTNGPAMKLRIEGLQKELSRMDKMPELQKFNDPEWQKQFAELAKNPPHFDFDFQKQLDAAKLAMDDAKVNALVDKSLKGQDEAMAKLQKELGSVELKEKLEEATRLLKDVQRQMDAMQAK